MTSIYDAELLLVDDNPDLLRLLCEQLSGAGIGAFAVAARFERFDFFYCFAAFEFQFDGFVYGKLTVAPRKRLLYRLGVFYDVFYNKHNNDLLSV